MAGGSGSGGGTQVVGSSRTGNHQHPGLGAQRFDAGFQTRIVNSYFLGHRFLYHDAHHVFLGYDLLLQAQPQADIFRASFLELGIGALDLPAFAPNKPRADEEGQSKELPLARYPAPQTIRVGDVISIELWVVGYFQFFYCMADLMPRWGVTYE